MPRFGTLDTGQLKTISTINGYKTDPLVLKGVQILEVHFEAENERADAIIPRTMHPAIPQYVLFNVQHVPESPWGQFSIAEVRIAGRTGVRPRGFVLRSFIDNDAAAKELASRWGFPVTHGEVTLRTGHDRVTGQVKAEGRTILEVDEVDRDVMSGGDIQYIASMHMARNKDEQKLILVQVDPEFVFHKAERGKPKLVTLDNEAWGAGSALNVTNPISATFTTADVTLPKVRYICDPEKPAMVGTTKVAA